MKFFFGRCIVLLLACILGIANFACCQNVGQVDSNNQFILNGSPFFPIGLFDATCGSKLYQGEAHINKVEAIGAPGTPFNTIVNYASSTCTNKISCPNNECFVESFGEESDEDIRRTLDEFHARGIKVIFSLAEYYYDPRQSTPSGYDYDGRIAHLVNTFKNHPAVIAWYMNDEKGDGQAGGVSNVMNQLEARYSLIKGLDPGRPIWSVHWDAAELGRIAHTTDIVGIDPYPLGGAAPITFVSTQADGARNSGKLLWLVPQIFVQNNHIPTRQEVRAMSYLAVNHGAKGLLYYVYWDLFSFGSYESRWADLKSVAGEIRDLSSIILSKDKTNRSDVVCSNGNIDVGLMRDGYDFYLIAVNTQNAPLNGVTFQLNQTLAAGVGVSTSFENNRQLAVQNNIFRDDFSAYQVHVYRWRLSQGSCLDLSLDSDGDGTPDCIDTFPLDPADKADFDQDGIGDNADLDDDGDGIPDEEELAGPNKGDGNLDGIADCRQGNVASFLSASRFPYLTLEAFNGAYFKACAAALAPGWPAPPEGKTFPYNFLRFTIKGMASGGETVVKLYLHNGARPYSYYNYGPTPDDPNDHWYSFLYDEQTGTGAKIDGDVISLHFVDGLRGDNDSGSKDSTVVSFGGPGFAPGGTGQNPGIEIGVTSPAGIGGGGDSSYDQGGWGCFIGSLASSI